jgi:hypothetical protein
MAYSTILAQIKTAVESVTNIGRVHDYLRYFKDEATFISLFKTTISGVEQIRGWTITRDAIPENSRYTTQGPHRMKHMFVIRGYLGVSDAIESEKTLQALVESVIEKLDNAVTLGSNVEVAGPATATIGHSELGRVLCHYAEINYPVLEQVSRAYV